MTEKWKPFNYEGERLVGPHYFVLGTREFECDIDNDGNMIGVPTHMVEYRVVIGELEYHGDEEHYDAMALDLAVFSDRPMSDDEWIEAYMPIQRPVFKEGEHYEI